MVAISVRGLAAEVRERLRVRAARHGRSMEAEIREILTTAVTEDEPSEDLFMALIDRFDTLGGVEFALPLRETPARAADFSGPATIPGDEEAESAGR